MGGEDFTNTFLEYCIQDFKRKTDVDISKNKQAKHRLRVLCDKAKCKLSFSLDYTLKLTNLSEGEDYLSIIKRSTFEELCQDKFDKLIPLIEQVLKDAKMNKSAVNEVVLVGGSTRIPKVQ